MHANDRKGAMVKKKKHLYAFMCDGMKVVAVTAPRRKVLLNYIS